MIVKKYEGDERINKPNKLTERLFTMKKNAIWVKAKILLTNNYYNEKFRLVGIICKGTKFGF